MNLREQFDIWFKEYPGTPTIGEIEDWWLNAIRERVENIRNDKELHLCAFNDGESTCACMERTLNILLQDL